MHPVSALQQHGIDVVHRLPLAGFVTERNRSYLVVKDPMLGHLNSTGSDVLDDRTDAAHHRAWPG